MGSTGGWNKPSANQPVKKGGAKAPSAWKGVVAGLVIVCALGGLCLWLFSGKDAAPTAKPEKKLEKIKTVTPAPAPKVADLPHAEVEKQRKIVGKRFDYKTHKTVPVYEDERQPKTEVKEDGADKRSDKRVFVHHVDQLLAMAMSVPEGVSGPPLPIPDDCDDLFREAYKTPIVIEDDDSDEVRILKKSVIECREAIREMMEKGMSVSQILKEHQEEANFSAKIFREANAELQKICDSGDADGAEVFCQAMNAAIEAQGLRVPKLEVPRKETREEKTLRRKMSKEQ